MRIQNATVYRLFGLIVGSMFLHACDGNSTVVVPPPPPPPAMASFDVTVSNLANAQPLSPIAVIGHRAGYTVFTIGDVASPGLEEMAEGGDNTALLAEAAADA
ncbi:MAG: spondin domain-containing protein, partial [Proteobacteria bacterium]|nr:spondin domain-containing protein [Pseudomonadota bacterium]